MAEASAKMHLREHVREDDVNFAISVMLDGFIQSQKYTVAKIIRSSFRSYRVRVEDNSSVLLHALDNLIKEQYHYVNLTDKTDVSEIKLHVE